jgi:hypothetical protein
MSSETFQILCQSCGSKLNAKVSLIGQTRNCPKCKASVLIQREEPVIVPPLGVAPPEEQSLRPSALDFQNRYFIVGHDRIVATWKGGEGWQVNVGTGFVAVRKNYSAIPDLGTFAFVELVMDAGMPASLNISKISTRGALTVIYRNENEILSKVEGACELTILQKDILLRHLRSIFMTDVLDQAQGVIRSLL